MVIYAKCVYFCVYLYQKVHTMNVNTNIILETRKPRLDGKYPVKLRLTYKRERHYYTLRDSKKESIYLSKDEFHKVMGERPREEHKKLRLLLNAHEDKAVKDIATIPVFTFDGFEAKYYGITENNTDLISCMKSKANRLRIEGRISTAIGYECSINSLISYTGKEYLTFDKVTIQFLNEYEKWMLTNSKSNSTIGIYLRNVRTAFGEAIRNGHLRVELYPFGKDKYTIPTGRNVKKALPISEVGLIAKYPAPNGTSEHRYRDYWYFGYLCNGINVKDMAHLKYSNIDVDVLTFVRAKTKRETKGHQKLITVVVTEDLVDILM